MKNTDDLPAVRQRMNLLFDFYGTLLTQKQADCFTMRYVDDYSLTEVAQELDASPQAVVDFIKRAANSLERYEEHLGLVRKHELRQDTAKNILSKLDECENESLAEQIRESIVQLASL